MTVIFYWLVANFFWVMLKVYNRLSVKGLDKPLAVRPPLIIAANHCSNLDPIVIGAAFPGRLRYLAKSELFSFAPFGFAIRALGAIPAKRDDMQGAAGALKFLLERIQKGESVLLFPEGRRSPDGKIQPLEGGVGLLAARTGAPVVPAFIHGTFEALPRGSAGYRPVKIALVFGDPIQVDQMGEGLSPKELRQAVTDELDKALRKLEGEFLLD
ncbi:MAG: lysophospholipid acyltransferase family protein [Thermovirgaceae bacterium]|nr:lysophospholipid acyltransferase family protein [Thermovirgaceae bacterium]